MSAGLGEVKGYLDLDISKFLAGLKEAREKSKSTFDDIDKSTGQKLMGMGSKMASVGKSMTKSLTLPILGIGAGIFKVSADFEQGMSKVKAISGATGKEFLQLKDKAKQLGASTAFSATEVANGMTEMAKAGWNSQQIMAGMEGVLNAASASGENLATVSTIVADAITGFGLKAKDASKVADLLTQAANSGTIDINDLGESFKYVAPVARSMGFNITDVTTALSAMSKAGIKGSQAGTSLRGMFSRLSDPTSSASKAVKELGVSITNSDGSFKSLNTILKELRGKMKGMTDEQKAYYASTIAGQQGMSGFLALMNMSQKEYDKLTKQMKDSNGVAKKTAEEMLANIKGQIIILKSALEGLGIQFGDALLPKLKLFVKGIQKLTNWFAGLSPFVKGIIVDFALLLAALGPGITILGKMTTGIGRLMMISSKVPGIFAAIKGFGAVIAGISAPVAATVAAVVGAIGTVVAIIITLWKTNKKFRDEVINIYSGVKKAFTEAFDHITKTINSFGFNFKNIIEVVKAVWIKFCNIFAPIITSALSYVATVIKGALKVITGVIDVFAGILKGDWSKVWEGLKSIVAGVFMIITAKIRAIWNGIVGVTNEILSWFGTSWSKVGSAISGIWDGITSKVSAAWEGIKDAVRAGIDFVLNIIGSADQLINSYFSFMWNGCKEIVASVWNAIKMIVSEALNFIWGSVISPILNGVYNFITTVWNNIVLITTTAFNGLKTVTQIAWTAIKDYIITPIRNAWSIGTSIVNSIVGTIGSGFSRAASVVSSVWSSVYNFITTPLHRAWSVVSGIISKLKSAFDFSWSLPHLKLPHISVSGGTAPFGIGGKGSLPKFSIKWYKDAMDNGMILDSPTIFGYKGGKFLGGGEAGSEVVVGKDSLLAMIRATVASVKMGVDPKLLEVIASAGNASALGVINSNAKLLETLETLVEKVDDKGLNKGDTYVFNSPKPIDEFEASRQMKQRKRELMEGF
jgi:TP901 family phage tail tape measure protein|nr:MAG TPA: minor tail protein [Caudoviricetes sp.]